MVALIKIATCRQSKVTASPNNTISRDTSRGRQDLIVYNLVLVTVRIYIVYMGHFPTAMGMLGERRREPTFVTKLLAL
jgi:hypothetical protein